MRRQLTSGEHARIRRELFGAVLAAPHSWAPESSLERLAALRVLGPHLQGEPRRRSLLRAQWEREVDPHFLPPSVGSMPRGPNALAKWRTRLYYWLGRLDDDGNLLDLHGRRLTLMRPPVSFPELGPLPVS